MNSQNLVLIETSQNEQETSKADQRQVLSMIRLKILRWWGGGGNFPCGPKVGTSSSNTWHAGLIPGQRSHMPWGQKTYNRSNIVTNSILLKRFMSKKIFWRVSGIAEADMTEWSMHARTLSKCTSDV